MLEIFQKDLKVFDENSLENLNFLIIFGKIVTTNRAFGNKIIFQKQFFGLGRISHFSRRYANGRSPRPPEARNFCQK